MTAGPPKHILAGDDSPEILALLRDILEGEGYRVTARTDALSLADIKQTRPDLVILDHMLEDGAGSGWELLRQLRRDSEWFTLPVVVCTGAIQQVRAGEEELARLGVEVVLKPFDIEHLLTAIHRFWPVIEPSRSAGGCAYPQGLAPERS